MFGETPVTRDMCLGKHISLRTDVLCVGLCFCKVIHSELKPLKAQRTLERITLVELRNKFIDIELPLI